MYQQLLSRITLNPAVGHGKPTVRNTRYLVQSILEYLAAGDSVEELVAEFPDLTREDVLACLAYAAEMLKYKKVSVTA